MKLSELLAGIPCRTDLPGDRVITGLAGDSRQVELGGVFVCRKGQKFDGHDHAAQALADGAAAVVVERDLGLPNQILVEDTHRLYPLLCANWFGNPSRSLRMVGVTGTNGKTTATFLIHGILEHSGRGAGLIGTVQNQFGSLVLPAKFTTPDPMQLHGLLERMVKAGCEYAVMEVSSHALEQRRVGGVRFEVGAFTNLTQDHLDYHHTMENYYAAKRKLFDQSSKAVVNADDPYGRRLLAELSETESCPTVSYSLAGAAAAFQASDIRFTVEGSRFTLTTPDGAAQPVHIPTPGDFSVQNAMTAALCCLQLGLTPQEVADGLAACGGVPGRFEVIPTCAPFTVIRDYAHGPDGIEKVLTTVAAFKGERRVGVLFGCPGMRDRTKRAKMGEKAASLSDFTILTSDNPREEPEQQILDDCLPGILKAGKPYVVKADRFEAIRYLVDCGEAGDILLLLGKGHEDYQVLSEGTICFDEKEIVQRFCRERFGG